MSELRFRKDGEPYPIVVNQKATIKKTSERPDQKVLEEVYIIEGHHPPDVVDVRTGQEIKLGRQITTDMRGFQHKETEWRVEAVQDLGPDGRVVREEVKVINKKNLNPSTERGSQRIQGIAC